ncbi:hypothetical protein ACFL10_01525 [Patescibacteria group bacterium]
MNSEFPRTAKGELIAKDPNDLQDNLNRVIDDSMIKFPDDLRQSRKKALEVGEKMIIEQVPGEGSIREEVMLSFLHVMSEKLPLPNGPKAKKRPEAS